MSFLGRMFARKPQFPDEYSVLIHDLQTEQTRSWNYGYGFDPKKSDAAQRILSLSPDEQRMFVLAAASHISALEDRHKGLHGVWYVFQTMTTVLRRRLPFDHDDVATLLDWSISQPYDHVRAVPQMIKVVEDFLKDNDLTPEIRAKIANLAECLTSGYATADTRRWAKRLRDVGGISPGKAPLTMGEAWSDVALAGIEAQDDAPRSAWINMLQHCAGATGSKPSGRWSKEAASLVERIGFPEFKSALLRWFPLVDKPRTLPLERAYEWAPDPNLLIEDTNADILKGLAWACSLREDTELSRALTALTFSAYRKVPQLGPRCVRVGNACVWALGNMPGTEGIGQLALLKVRVKFGTAQKGIDKALNAAAEQAGIPREEIEEMSVPAYGLTEVGMRQEKIGEFTAEIHVTGTSATELRWIRPDSRPQKSVPKAVKDNQADELKELKAAAKDIQKMLPAQRDRIENLYLEEKAWSYPLWRERYLDHPLVGTLARRLIWKFTDGELSAAGIWYEGGLAGRNGRPLDWIGDDTRVELWHPIGESTEEVLAWRDWLAELEIRQPFKQAHREVYLLTDAERTTRTYSNRFAAHVLKQHQFNALCAARGWKNSLRLMVDDDFPPASRTMPAHGLRAEYWVEGIGENYGTDTNDSGTYLYLVTDQVRFYPISASENYAHAGGGGYYARRFNTDDPTESLALEDVPPLVLSEIMRDADLFVGVASVGNDPNWSDGGPGGRFRDYWTGYSFGELTETAKTRKQVLQKLVPRLKISDRCRLEGRFLVVRGDVRTYKIHLGSGNILMQPNDQYLCIVQSRGAANTQTGKVFLPFEGDGTLALILSKAFLLAEDRKIQDPTILHQIRR